MKLSKEAAAICSALNEFKLPRAIGHLSQNCFVAWNESFQERTGYAPEQLEEADLKDVVVLFEPDSQVQETVHVPSPDVEFVRCNIRCYGQEHFATGYAARRNDGFVLFMIDVVNPTTGAIEDARLFGREEERNRIMKLFHDEVSPKLLAAVFEVQRAKEELDAKGLKEGQAVSKAGEKLIETIDAVISVLDPDEPNPRSTSSEQS
jgi:hypothetical protein